MSWFKNLQVRRLPSPWSVTAEELEQWLAPHAFQPGGSVEDQRVGWVPPRGDKDASLVYSLNRQFLITYRAEKKLLPGSVITQFTKMRAAELEEQQGFKPGRKQMRELKDQVRDELLPRAFSISRDTRIWIDAANGWLVVDAGSATLADDVIGLLVKSVGTLPLSTLRVARSPVSAMTEWLLSGDAPAGFTTDQDTELTSPGKGNATVRYVGHELEAAEMRKHIESGKQCMRLSMTYEDRISFILTPSLTLKRVTALDVIKEASDPTAQNDDERFEADTILMTAEYARLLAGVVEALGGEQAGEQREAA